MSLHSLLSIGIPALVFLVALALYAIDLHDRRHL